MKNYYYNPKTRDLMVYDTETNEILTLEVIMGIHVITSSEIREPRGEEPVKHWKNHGYDPIAGKAKPGGKRRKVKAVKTATRGKHTCKNCGELGHNAKTCQKVPKVAPETDNLPDEEVTTIVRAERNEEETEAIA